MFKRKPKHPRLSEQEQKNSRVRELICNMHGLAEHTLSPLHVPGKRGLAYKLIAALNKSALPDDTKRALKDHYLKVNLDSDAKPEDFILEGEVLEKFKEKLNESQVIQLEQLASTARALIGQALRPSMPFVSGKEIELRNELLAAVDASELDSRTKDFLHSSILRLSPDELKEFPDDDFKNKLERHLAKKVKAKMKDGVSGGRPQVNRDQKVEVISGEGREFHGISGEFEVPEKQPGEDIEAQHIKEFLGQADRHIMKGKMLNAVHACHAVLQLQPKHSTAMAKLEEIYELFSKREDGEEVLTKVIESHHEDALARYFLGNYYLMKNEPEKARECYDFAVQLDSNLKTRIAVDALQERLPKAPGSIQVGSLDDIEIYQWTFEPEAEMGTEEASDDAVGAQDLAPNKKGKEAATEADDMDKWTPLMTAARQENTEDVRRLLEEGVDPNEANNSGWTPLLLVSKNGNVEIMRLLLENPFDPEKQADPDQSNAHGTTPLMLAASNGHEEAVDLLLEFEADPTKRNNKGETALDILEAEGEFRLLDERGPIAEKLKMAIDMEGALSEKTDKIMEVFYDQDASKEDLMDSIEEYAHLISHYPNFPFRHRRIVVVLYDLYTEERLDLKQAQRMLVIAYEKYLEENQTDFDALVALAKMHELFAEKSEETIELVLLSEAAKYYRRATEVWASSGDDYSHEDIKKCLKEVNSQIKALGGEVDEEKVIAPEAEESGGLTSASPGSLKPIPVPEISEEQRKENLRKSMERDFQRIYGTIVYGKYKTNEEREEMDQAVDQYMRFTSSHPDFEWDHREMVRVLRRIWLEGKASFEAVHFAHEHDMKADPKNPEAVAEWGITHFEINNYESLIKAEDLIIKVLEMKDEKPTGRYTNLPEYLDRIPGRIKRLRRLGLVPADVIKKENEQWKVKAFEAFDLSVDRISATVLTEEDMILAIKTYKELTDKYPELPFDHQKMAKALNGLYDRKKVSREAIRKLIIFAHKKYADQNQGAFDPLLEHIKMFEQFADEGDSPNERQLYYLEATKYCISALEAFSDQPEKSEQINKCVSRISKKADRVKKEMGGENFQMSMEKRTSPPLDVNAMRDEAIFHLEVHTILPEYAPVIDVPLTVVDPEKLQELTMAAYQEYRDDIVEYQKAIEENPHDHDAHFELGFALFELRDYKAAMKEFLIAHELDPEDSLSETHLEKISKLIRGKEKEAIRKNSSFLRLSSNGQSAFFENLFKDRADQKENISAFLAKNFLQIKELIKLVALIPESNFQEMMEKVKNDELIPRWRGKNPYLIMYTAIHKMEEASLNRDHEQHKNFCLGILILVEMVRKAWWDGVFNEEES